MVCFKMVKNCTCVRCNYCVCRNVSRPLIQMDAVPVWCVAADGTVGTGHVCVYCELVYCCVL